MTYKEFDERKIQTFEYETTINSNCSILGNCELGRATIQLLNDDNKYSTFKESWIKTIHGSFYIYNVEPVQEKINIKLECYDIKYKLDTKYDKNRHSFPCTLKEWRNSIFRECDVEFDNSDFPNSDLILNSQPYVGDNPSNRSVIALIAQAGASTIVTDENDKFYFKWFSNKVHTIDDWIELTTEKESSEPINCIVLGRGNVEDNVSYPQTVAIPHEFRIDNNYILDPQTVNGENDLRYTTIVPIYNQIKDFSYLIYNMRTQKVDNKLSIELGDKVKYFDIWGNELLSYVMTKKITYLGGDINDDNNYEISLSASEINETSTELRYSSSVQNDILKVERKADKNSGIIEDMVEEISTQNTKISKITQTVDEINSKISDIADITISGESSFASFELDNINESEPIMIRIRPTVRNISYIYPSPNLYPSENLFSPARKIRFHNKSTNENFDYELPDDLLIYDNETYDEFYLDYDSHTCEITKRCKYNTSMEVVKLDSEVVKNYPYPSIELTNGNYVISLPSYDSGYIFARLMVQNIYTTQFATKAEVSSQINQTAQSIDISVDTKLSRYSTTTQMNSAISLKANEITSSVSETYATKATTNQLSSRISQSAKSIELITDDNGTSAGITIRLKNEDGTQIDEESGNITMNGLVSFNDLSSAGSTTINGSNITTGKINADLIKAGTLNGNNVTITNLNASNIKSGTLTSRAINNGNGTFSVSSNGTIYAKSGTIGGWNLSSSKLYGTSSSTQYAISPSGIEDETHSRSIGWSQLISSSDERLKNNIRNIEDKYNQFYDDLKPVSFKFNDGIDNGNLHFGFIAQDVLKSEKLVNENLSMIEETDKFYNLYKQEIIALNTWQIQMLKEEVRLLKEEINKLKEKSNGIL